MVKYSHKNRVLTSRYELKYLIDESRAAAIVRFIRPYARLDRHCESQPNDSYPIVSLYLDTDNLQLCRQTLEGHKNRFKLRIRSYSDDLDCPDFFEIKRRANTVIIKDRVRVAPSLTASLVSGISRSSQKDESARQNMNQFLFYMNSISAKPVVRTRYDRHAFEGIVNNKVRITFDRNLSYNVTSTPNVGLNGHGWHKLPLKSVVLEIKFTDRYPIWLNQLVKCFELRQQPVSKYATSIKASCMLKYCAPQISSRVY
jgi:SPX domain protein involved in polyphosphate accumulation